MRVNKRGDTRIALTISNPGKQIVNDLVIQLDMSEAAKDISLSAEIIGTKIAKYRYDKNTHIIYVYINDLLPDESRTYYFDYFKPNT